MKIKTWCIIDNYINNCNDCDRLWDEDENGDCESKKRVDLYKLEEYNLLISNKISNEKLHYC